MKNKTKQIIDDAEKLETAMTRLPTRPCLCVLSELLEDFTPLEIGAVVRFQTRICALLCEKTIGGDLRANNHLLHVLERRKQLEESEIFDEEILEG